MGKRRVGNNFWFFVQSGWKDDGFIYRYGEFRIESRFLVEVRMVSDVLCSVYVFK